MRKTVFGFAATAALFLSSVAAQAEWVHSPSLPLQWTAEGDGYTCELTIGANSQVTGMLKIGSRDAAWLDARYTSAFGHTTNPIIRGPDYRDMEYGGDASSLDTVAGILIVEQGAFQDICGRVPWAPLEVASAP